MINLCKQITSKEQLEKELNQITQKAANNNNGDKHIAFQIRIFDSTVVKVDKGLNKENNF